MCTHFALGRCESEKKRDDEDDDDKCDDDKCDDDDECDDDNDDDGDKCDDDDDDDDTCAFLVLVMLPLVTPLWGGVGLVHCCTDDWCPMMCCCTDGP